jgi:L-aspartate oxidase
MLATGGAGHVYPCTTNPAVATGDGMAMAHRAGATMANLEFVQFHPTALYAPGATNAPGGSTFLISEAVRGAGGRLYNGRGERFMAGYDGRAELAPRDVVARCIDRECKRLGEPCVWLDISHKPASDILTHFPNIAAHCAALGIDITRQRIPVRPAAHYFCGGVVTDLFGQTSVPGLFAAGEVACTGLHGANRLASNSLLEGVVFSRRAAPVAHQYAERCAGGLAAALRTAAAEMPLAGQLHGGESSTAGALRAHLQSLMWASAGIVRTSAGLEAGLCEARSVRVASEALLLQHGMHSQAEQELRNLATVGELVLRCALLRKESRGLHYNTDFPVAVEQERRPSVISGERAAYLASTKRGVFETASLLAR